MMTLNYTHLLRHKTKQYLHTFNRTNSNNEFCKSHSELGTKTLGSAYNVSLRVTLDCLKCAADVTNTNTKRMKDTKEEETSRHAAACLFRQHTQRNCRQL